MRMNPTSGILALSLLFAAEGASAYTLFEAGARTKSYSPMPPGPAILPKNAGRDLGGIDIPPSNVLFQNDELLSNPTRSSVTLSLVPAEDAEIYIEYGPSSGYYAMRTDTQTVANDEPAVFRLDGISPGSEFYYRVRCRKPSSQVFGARRERQARTLRMFHPTFSFAFMSDSHVLWAWVERECKGDDTDARYFEKTLENIRASGVDFLVVGGDEALTHSFTLRECFMNGESTGRHTVSTQREAELRYMVMRTFYETTCHSLPLVFVLGNHDGEAGFVDSSCYYYPNTMEYSINARLKYIPSPSDAYGGGPVGNYYAFTAGDALFVVLDVMRYTTVTPRSPEDWTLGEEQLLWLEQTLAVSRKKWKFVFAHHLVGGDSHTLCYQYARGGAKATQNGETNGIFLGEQAVIHQMMKDYGADIFFYGHDHIFATAEKLDTGGNGEGIYYVAAGRGSGGVPWAEEDWFRNLYDYTGDGLADFLTEIGFLKVTVYDTSYVNIQYIKTDPFDPQENGRILADQDIWSE